MVNLTPATPVLSTKLGSYFILPSFNFANNVWLGAPFALGQFNFVSPEKFCLIDKTFPLIGNFALVIGYRDGQNKVRYILNSLVDGIFFPLYTNQRIKQNFFIEIWSTSTLTPALSSAPINFSSSIKYNRTRFMYPSQGDILLYTGIQVGSLISQNNLNLPLQFNADAVGLNN